MSILVGGPWEHDVFERLDYQVSWADWLVSGESVASVDWTTEGGVVQSDVALEGSVSSFWIEVEEGAAQRDLAAYALVTTSQGRVFRGHTVFRVRDGR
jgi:hypothetical protein